MWKINILKPFHRHQKKKMSKDCCVCLRTLEADVDVGHLFVCSHALCVVCLDGFGNHPLRQVCFTCATPDAVDLPEMAVWQTKQVSNTLLVDPDADEDTRKPPKKKKGDATEPSSSSVIIIGPIGPEARHLEKLGGGGDLEIDDDDVIYTRRSKELEAFLRSMRRKRTEAEKREAAFEAHVDEVRQRIAKHAQMCHSLIDRDAARLLQQLEEARTATLTESRAMRDGVGAVIDRTSQLMAKGQPLETKDVEQVLSARVNGSVQFQQIQVALNIIVPKDEGNVVARITFQDTPDDFAVLSPPALIGSIPGNSFPVTGIAVLDREVFVVNDTDPEVFVFQVGTVSSSHATHKRSLSLLHLLSPSLIPFPLDLDACPQNRCVYVLDAQNSQVYRLVPTDGYLVAWWAVRNPRNLSVTSSGSVLVTEEGKVVEYDPKGRTIRSVLPPSGFSALRLGGERGASMRHPRHAVEFDGGAGLVVSDFLDDRTPHVVYVTERCKGTPSRWHGNAPPTSGADGFDEPRHLAVVDVSGHVMVADRKNNRVVLLNRKLEYVRDLVKDSEVNEVRSPMRLRLDQARGHLYVGQSNGVTLIFRVLL